MLGEQKANTVYNTFRRLSDIDRGSSLDRHQQLKLLYFGRGIGTMKMSSGKETHE
jgi:hypothetical protein